MLATICDDTWNVLNMQHITPNSKIEYYSDILVVTLKKIKGPTHMVEGGHHLRNPHPPPNIIGPDNGLSRDRRQAIIWKDNGILLIVHLGTNFSEILIVTHTFSLKKMHLKMSSGK